MSNAVVLIHMKNDFIQVFRKNCKSTDLFEGASLSKTVFAMLTEPYIDQLKSEQQDSINALINHVANLDKDSTACDFKYTDLSYSYAMLLFDRWAKYPFAMLLNKKYPFVYVPGMELLPGFIKQDSLARYARHKYQLEPSGTLLVNEEIGQLLLKETMQWLKDKRRNKVYEVCDYQKLYWSGGIGLDSSMGRSIYFQWGDNWCFNHILLCDPEFNEGLLILTNSVIGAHEIANYLELKYGRRLIFLDFIKWW